MEVTSLAEKLKVLRVKTGVSQRELARLLNMSHSTLAMYETGKRHPDYSTLLKLASFYNVSIDWLLGHNSDPTKSSNDKLTLQEIEDVIRNNDLQFDGAPLDEHDKEEVIEFIRLVLKRHKQKHKNKTE